VQTHAHFSQERRKKKKRRERKKKKDSEVFGKKLERNDYARRESELSASRE